MGAHSLVSPRLLIYVFQVEPVTVCIPAKNEESCLGRLIDSVMEQDIGNIAEILICVNGSTDNTLSVAKSLEDRIPFLRVITSNPGKANACNALVTESKYDLLLFVDADIVLFRHALSTAYRCLFSDPELILVSTATARVNESMELGYSFIIRPFVIHGRFYLVKKNKLLERMRLIAGTAQIPSYIINEDAWVGMVATKGEPKYRFNRVIQEPLALYRGPEGLRDKFRTIVRVRRGRSQIRYFFGAAPEKNSIGTLVKICLGRQRSGRGMLKAIAQFFFCTIRAFALATTYKIMDLYNAIFYPVRRSIARGRAAVWNSVKSTKLPIEIKGGREG